MKNIPRCIASCSVLLLLFLIGGCNVSLANEKTPDSISTKQLDKIIFKGTDVYDRGQLLSVIRPLFKTDTSIQSKEFQNQLKDLVREKYITDGYILSDVQDILYNKKTDTLEVFVIEGMVSEFFVDDELLKVKYLRGYIDKILSLKPFDINKANKYFLLIKKLLGGSVDFKIKLLKKAKNGDPTKIADITCNTYNKYEGIFSAHNHTAPSNLKEDHIKDVELMMQGGYFTLGDLTFKVANPYNTPSTTMVTASTSADEKENYAFISNKYQLNKHGTKLVTGFGYSKFNFYKKMNSTVFQIGLEQPLQHKKQMELNLYSNLNTSSIKSVIKNSTDKVKDSSNKITAGLYLKHVSALDIEQTYDVAYHVGRAKKSKSPSLEAENYGFQKYTDNAKVVFKLPKEIKLNLEIDGQYAPRRIPDTELYTPATILNGKGLLYLDVNARSGYLATVQLSHFTNLSHALFYGLDKYAYYEYDVAKCRSASNDRQIVSASLGAIGAGVDLYLVDKLVLNVEMNQRLSQKNYDNTNSKRRIFAGIKYYFMF